MFGVVERKHASPEKFWTCAAIHGAFNGLQPVDLPLRLTIAPGQLDRIPDCVAITAQNSGETRDSSEACADDVIDPRVELFWIMPLRIPWKRIASLRMVTNSGEPCLSASTFLV